MSVVGSVKALFQADTGGLKKGADEAHGILEKLRHSAHALEAGLAAFAAERVFDWLKEGAVATEKLAAQTRQLESILSAGVEPVKNTVDSLERMFGLDDDVLVESARNTAVTLRELGFSAEEAGGATSNILKRSADLAKFWGVSVPEASEKLTRGILGATRGLRDFGITIDDTEIKQEAYRLGLAEYGQQLGSIAEAQARYSLILQKTANAQGEAARQNGTVASQWQRTVKMIEDAQKILGQTFAPLIQAISAGIIGLSYDVQLLGRLLQWIFAQLAKLPVIGDAIRGLGQALDAAPVNAMATAMDKVALANHRAAEGFKISAYQAAINRKEFADFRTALGEIESMESALADKVLASKFGASEDLVRMARLAFTGGKFADDFRARNLAKLQAATANLKSPQEQREQAAAIEEANRRRASAVAGGSAEFYRLDLQARLPERKKDDQAKQAQIHAAETLDQILAFLRSRPQSDVTGKVIGSLEQ